MGVAALAMIAAIACEETGSGSSSGSTAVSCRTVGASVVSAIEETLTVDGGGTLRSARAVKSNDFNNVWMLAADIQGPGLDGTGDIGVWAVNSLTSVGLTYSANNVARAFSQIGPGNTSPTDHGVAEARRCVQDALK